MGITSENMIIPALADLVNAYSMHFQAQAMSNKYEARIQLANLFGKSSVSGFVTRNPELPNLRKVLNDNPILRHGFGSYSDGSEAESAVKFIVMLHEAAEKI